ncbi:Carboxylic ester hydrolase [Fusarium keratoplasticum]|uniref:Carboxylic ester hydrolase n=1 Tax=Fusarium keratoplasticum TaxID=1328300 RepID=A0ACC0RDC1_9HYPO|nr:Carboxylic ester hydrolase [Fusarium keratoplasticum]KAI8683557.1 Carboxylic ester hydrolase [Fusarium keratoplasticum]KAI8687678.1 Carboxylic ester hydrolase [Fusarium keratoplasticum]
MKFHSLFGFGLIAGSLAAPAALPVPHPVPQPATPATLEERAAKVTVAVPSGTVIGSSLGKVESFRGIPFADPPTGSLRLKPPKRLSKPLGNFDASGLVGPSCPQMFISTGAEDVISKFLSDFLSIPFLQVVTGQEDCLTMTVQRPVGTKAGDKLPVLFWIFGGGFELGSSAMYDGTSLLGTGIDQKQPFIFVAVNYRVAGFGFMPGAELANEGSTNLGLLDQRMGLEWVADNIAAFGGDPDKVTIWGESAGAISVLDQMTLFGGDADYKGKPLFRGAIMNSGSVVPAEPVDSPKAQEIFDTVVQNAGCSSASNSLDCLRGLPYDKFLDAANSVPGLLSYNSLALSYLPRPDGHVLPESPEALIAAGRYHAVPMINGNQEDEGTLFALFQPNLTTTEKLVDYLKEFYFSAASKTQLTNLVNSYSSSITAGSPFRTGILNEIFPGFKRRAAIFGDLVFTLTRRLFLQTATDTNPDVPAWSYLASYDYGTPVLGTLHGSDLIQVFFGILPNNAMRSIRTYYYNFLYNLDPNVGVTKYANWPEWKESKKLMWFKSANGNDILNDDFRQTSYNWIASNVGVLRV